MAPKTVDHITVGWLTDTICALNQLRDEDINPEYRNNPNSSGFAVEMLRQAIHLQARKMALALHESIRKAFG